MLDININLISQKKKDRLKRLTIFLFLKNILAWLVISIVLSAIILLWGWLVLIDEFQYLSESTLVVNKEYTKYNQEVRKTNNLIRDFNKMHQGYRETSPNLIELSENLPYDIQLNSLTLNNKSKTITINGTAQTRSSLLNYQEKLKNLEWIGAVSVPTKQLLKQNNINFSFETKIK